MSKEETPNSKQEQATSPAWLKVEQARHPKRPSPMDFISGIFVEFSEIHGDRAFGDDEAVVCGMAQLDSNQVMVIGIRKGTTLKERIKTYFGMPHPEGYRKALRCMRIAEKFGRPVISIVDVTAAYPGPGAEERGQAEAIARNLRELSRLRVPTISVITGRGGIGWCAGVSCRGPRAYARKFCVLCGSPGVCSKPHLEKSGAEAFGRQGYARLGIRNFGVGVRGRDRSGATGRCAH